MRRLFVTLPLFALIAACSGSDSLENQGQQVGADADNAIERASNQVDAAQNHFNNRAANVSEKAHSVKEDVKKDLDKAGNAIDAAAAELKK